jgi:hypothetical protein
MATPTIAAAEALPRFLLPRLSWGASPAMASRSTRLLIPRQQWAPAFAASLHTGNRSSRPTGRYCSQHEKNSVILRRAFHATERRQRDHHFDTLKFVQRLQSEGFTEDQSVAMMKVLNDVIEER